MGKEFAGNDEIYFGIVHARDIKSAEKLLEEAKSQYNVKDVVLTDLSLSLATNFGPGTLGLVFYPAG